MNEPSTVRPNDPSINLPSQLKRKRRAKCKTKSVRRPKLAGEYPVGELVTYLAYLSEKGNPYGLPVGQEEIQTLEMLARRADDYVDKIITQNPNGPRRTFSRFCPKASPEASL